MKYKDHIKSCQEKTGKPWYNIHLWLDAYARKYGSQQGRHRVYRHHKEGVEEVRAKWGDEAAKAAEVHIIDDLGHVPTRDAIEKMFDMQ